MLCDTHRVNSDQNLPPQPPTADEPPGPGYWKASDGNWYPPESSPAPTTPPVPTAPPGPAMAQMPAAYGPAVPAGTELSGLGKRFGNFLLGIVLMIVTLGIGYLIWAFIAYGQGQTPAKQVLKMYVVDERTGLPASWGTMFLRGWIIDGLLGQITFGVFGLVSALWIFSGDTHQRLTDKMVKTIVVDAPNGLPA
jgi:uncharacterized RDD family membrane protein YckC